ncbi:MAG: hypothetical protein LBD23_07595 [Oscillospiraceae bacterium]|jgi:aspartyl-tRNA(Asn)/glutamyl-tRNA(Gln) amidotransferase subunit A|nr:hypothetical protein [Oscillospiraceae bacterium]
MAIYMKYTAILENSLMQKDLLATAGSRMLEKFISPIDATVAVRLESAGVNIVGRANTSEFGVSGLFAMVQKYEANSSILSNGAILTDSVSANEQASRVAEGGADYRIGDYENDAVTSIADGVADFAFCNDYTGAVSRAAALHGVYYIHPTYGTVSRYGLIQSVSSMDQIGIVCKTPEDGFKALGIIKGYDPKDGIMSSDPPESTEPPELAEPTEPPEPPMSSQTQSYQANLPPTMSFNPTAYSDVYKQVMQILCCAELSNNISRYDGIKIGHRAKDYNGLHELYTKSRTEAFGADVKLAAILGAMILSHENYMLYYNKAMQLRRLIKESLEFDKYDVIVTKCPLLSRLCGLPSLTTPEHTYIANAGCDRVLEEV